MSSDPANRHSAGGARDRSREPDLAELCRRHGLGLDVVERSHDIAELIERAVAEFEARHWGPAEAAEPARDLRSLVTFACAATLLHERAVVALQTSVGPSDERVSIEVVAELLGSLGTLVHEINNPLTALIGRAQLLRLQREIPPRALYGVEVIEASSQRIANKVRELGSMIKAGRGLVTIPRENDAPPSESPSGEPSR